MKKRWVTPSFGDSSVEPAKKRSAPRKRTQPSVNAAAPQLSTAEHSTLTWLEKYQPKTPDDLVIHPKKVKEVEEWFRNYASFGTEKYLILSGPCGCGKATTLRVLAKSLNFEVLEWITPLDRDYDVDNRDANEFYEKASDVFETFLSRASRYPSLFSVAAHKLIFVKDFPNVFLRNPETLHQIIRKYLHVNTYPVVFICNDDQVARNLFPDTLRKECSMRTISFNPVTSKAVVKALQRVLDLERRSNPDVSVRRNINLERIYESSTGDLRSAILKLYFVAVKGLSDESETVEKGGASTSDGKDKDEATDLFRILGRVLYASRRTTKEHEYSFVHDPADIVDSVSMQPSTFLGFLQENYVSRFSAIESISMAANALSYSDVLLTRFDKDTMNVGLTLATRGLMVANDNPVKSFKPFVKPRFCEASLETSVRKEISDTFNTFQHSARDIILYTLPLLSKSNYSFGDEERRNRALKFTAPFRRKY
jgi:cell cycle checkpoint protein